MLIILITINQIIPEQMMPGDPCNWLLVKTLFFNQTFVWHEENLPGRVSWVVLLCSQWLVTGLDVCMLRALKAGRNSTKETGTGLQLSSVLEQSILCLSTMIFRSISMNILWSSAFLLLIQLSMEEGRVILHLLASYSAEWVALPAEQPLSSQIFLTSRLFVPKEKPGEEQILVSTYGSTN